MRKWRQLPLNRVKVMGLILVFVLVCSSVAVGKTEAKVEIDYRVKAKGRSLQLGDIATIKGNKQFKQRLATINLGQAPLPGYTSVLKREYILALIQNAGFNLREIDYKIPKQIRVTTPYQLLDKEELVTKVREYIQQNLDLPLEDVEVKVGRLNGQIKVPTGKVDLRIGQLYSRDLIGSSMIPVEVYVDGRLTKKEYIQVQVTAYEEVLVAKDLIKRHQSISKADFKLERIDISTLYGYEPFIDFDSIKNYRTERTINPGQVLTRNLLEIPPLVKRRRQVKIIAEVGQVKVSTKGIALESGVKGQIIKVENMSSGQELMAKVLAKNTVKVIL
ncbi:flagella basal body P-ring formation protein FlgA [Candidatus Frackibacter sp. WG12]|nr:flagella basal body P-ring formation protein FlgA [Candidatus Frackibacter sp. WG11]SEM37411.1 flagella basal body P-ring formation protein FlgA [Candidatus Frackibacter sp. WG12]SFL42871.1 flagella basal body P-ring formation protein FlgA [Candidatus Frackibacter sp. WG13]